MLNSKTITATKDISNFQAFCPTDRLFLNECVDQHVRMKLARIAERPKIRDASNHCSSYVTCSKRRLSFDSGKPPNFALKLRKLIIENEDLITWHSGEIHIMRPVQKLEERLSNYFRHNKFTSLQRQLNNFGFLKSFEASGSSVSVYSRVDMAGLPVDELLCLRALQDASVQFDTTDAEWFDFEEDFSERHLDWPVDLDWA